MKRILGILLLVNLTLLATANQPEDNEVEDEYVPGGRQVGRCVSGEDCGRMECSVMGMQRFSEPHCAALRGEGASCIVDAKPENRSLAFPDKQLECSNVYTLYCPCQPGLTCQAARCVRPKGAQSGGSSGGHHEPRGERLRSFPWAFARVH